MIGALSTVADFFNFFGGLLSLWWTSSDLIGLHQTLLDFVKLTAIWLASGFCHDLCELWHNCRSLAPYRYGWHTSQGQPPSSASFVSLFCLQTNDDILTSPPSLGAFQITFGGGSTGTALKLYVALIVSVLPKASYDLRK